MSEVMESELFNFGNDKTKETKQIKVNRNLKNITTRKNKYYTSIFLNHWNKGTFLDGLKYNNILDLKHLPHVIKLSKNCINEMNQDHNHEDFKPEKLVNKKFNILGVNFKVVNADNGNYWVELHDHVNNETDQIGAFEGEDLFWSLHEHVFENLTGTLLYF